jgi:DNA-binding LacI/PurR family transcriptional regulator/nitrogen-specific signal transduction histidine kinase
MTSTRNNRITIGLLIEDVRYNYPYHQPLWQAISDAAQARGVNLICFSGDLINAPEMRRINQCAIYDLAARENVQGLLLSSALGGHLSSQELRRFCARYHPPLPMIGIGLALEDMPGIFVDNTCAMRNLVTHLIEAHNCHRIAFIQGPEDNEEAEQRFHSYVEALNSHGLDPDPALILPGDFRVTGGARAVQLLLDEQKMQPGVDFEAVVAANDLMALQALFSLQARGVRIPQDTALTGFDDINTVATAIPPLTTVRQPLEEIGRRAVDMLLALLAGESVAERVTLPAELVIRQSCGCPNPAALHVGEERAQREPIPEAERRGRIIAEMVQAAGSVTPEAQQEIATQSAMLFDAFYADIGGAKSFSTFLETLDQTLQSAASQSGRLTWCRAGLAVLYHHTLLDLTDRERLARALEMWQRAWLLLADAMQQSTERERQGERGRVFTWLVASRAIAAAPDVSTLMDVVADQILPLNLDGCYIALYEDPASPTTWSRLVLACDRNTRIELEADGRRFPSRQLLPEGLLSPDRAHNLMLKPLIFGDEWFGFAIFAMREPQQLIYASLSAQISGALKGTQMIHAIETHAHELEAHNAELDAFAHTVAHDLKNPLSSLVLLGTMLQAKFKDMPFEEVNNTLQRISQTGYKLTAITNELLLLSSVRKEEVQLEPLDMADIVAEAQRRLSDVLAEHQVEITEATEWPMALGHSPWVEEIWFNYISNAIKYGGHPEKGKTPRVELGFDEPVNAHVRFWVRDNGPGLTPDEQSRLFAPFTRLHQVRVEGHGLGLSIVQRIAEKLGGEVGVESEVGKGSVFYFTLPTAPVLES